MHYFHKFFPVKSEGCKIGKLIVSLYINPCLNASPLFGSNIAKWVYCLSTECLNVLVIEFYCV